MAGFCSKNFIHEYWNSELLTDIVKGGLVILRDKIFHQKSSLTLRREMNFPRICFLREVIPLCIPNLYNILCTVNTQHTSRHDAIITIRS